MIQLTRSIAVFLTFALWCTPARVGFADTPPGDLDKAIHDYLAAHPDELGDLVRAYLVKHPDVLRDMFIALMKQRAAAKANLSPLLSTRNVADRNAAIAPIAQALFNSPHQVTLGNPSGDVTLVEFFDYSCGYCKRALADTIALLGGDPKLKLVLKEFPILGPGSTEAAHVAIAVRMQDADGRKYLAFHRELLSEAGPADKDRALAAAKDQGLDLDRLQRDMASAEVQTTIDESLKLSTALGLSGTPSYVIGAHVLQGAVGLARLQSEIALVRAQPRTEAH
jgi:protein-disulfide isomerase